MIGHIKGTLHEIENGTGLIETSTGVSYLVALPTSFTGKILPLEVKLYTYLYVREDALALYGFESKQDYTLFTLLIGISGIGPKVGFSIINQAGAAACIEAVRKQDVDFFHDMPGIGKKTAIKIVLELAGKLDNDYSLPQLHKEDKELLNALQSLGYKSGDIRKIMNEIEVELSLEEKIKKGIRLLSSSHV